MTHLKLRFALHKQTVLYKQISLRNNVYSYAMNHIGSSGSWEMKPVELQSVELRQWNRPPPLHSGLKVLKLGWYDSEISPGLITLEIINFKQKKNFVIRGISGVISSFK